MAADAFGFTTKKGVRSGGATSTRSSTGATVTKLGVLDLNFHDLQHTGTTLAAQAGASLAD